MAIGILWRTSAGDRQINITEIDRWLATYLRVQLLVEDAVIARLDAWARQAGRSVAFPNWREAAEAAARELNMPAFRQGKDRAEDLQWLARQATYLVADVLVLTGSRDAGELTRSQQDHAASAERLLKVAPDVSPLVRGVIRAGDVQQLVSQSGSTRRLDDWQAPLVLELMANPYLVINLPAVVLPDHIALAGRLVEQKGVDRISGLADLAAAVGPRQVVVKETFIASSGSGRGFARGMIEHRYSYHEQPATSWLEYDGKGVGNVVHPYYTAYPVSSGDRDAHDRSLDAEKQLFEAVRERLVQLCVEQGCGPHEVTGTLTVHSQIRMCASCYMVALQFLAEFRNLKVTISREESD